MTSLSSSVRKHPLAEALVWFMTVFLVLFPKGGIKVGGLPLTWGYLAILLMLPFLALVRLLAMPLRVQWTSLVVVGSVIPFATAFIYSGVTNGVISPSYAFSSFVGLCVLPPIFLLIYPAFLPWINGERFARTLCLCMLVAALWGIFLFFWHPLTGHLIEIPYLTVNADDYGLIEKTKHINRGFFLKLISTYNNGNLYGVATLILLPLFDVLEPKRWKRNTLKLALVLTLSRTVWAGMILMEVLSFVRIGGKTVQTFPRVSFGPAVKKGLIIVSTVALVLIGLVLESQDLSYLFDKQLGGRAGSLNAFSNPTLLPAHPVGAFSEIVYASALTEYGVVGLLSVLLIFTLPVFLVLVNPGSMQSPIRRAALKGIIMYMVMAALDGALNLIPVMVFYWFAYMIFLEGWPGRLDLLPAPSAPNLSQPSLPSMENGDRVAAI